MGFPRHEYWSGLPCPPPGALLDPEIEPTSLTSTCIYRWVFYPCASLVAQRVKNLPAMQETGVQSLGQEDALKKGIASHSSILACRILWTENPDGLQSMGLQRVRHDWAINTHSLFITSATREAWQPRDHQSNVASPGFPNSSSHCALLWSGEPRLSLPTRLMTGKRAGNDLSIFVSLQAWAPPPILEDYICCSVAKSCPTLCDPMDCSIPGFTVLHYLPEFAQIHVIESVMLSNYLIFCYLLLLLPSIFPSIRVFSNESAHHIRWPKTIRRPCSLVAQSCSTLCNPVDCSPPGSSVLGDSPGKNSGVSCHALLQGAFRTQGLNSDLPHCRRILYHLSTREAQYYAINNYLNYHLPAFQLWSSVSDNSFICMWIISLDMK